MIISSINKLSFEERIEWLEDYFNKNKESDGFKSLIIKLIFTDTEIETMKTIKTRIKNLNILLNE